MLNVPLGSTTALVPVVCGLFALNSVYTPFHTYYIHADHYWNEKLLVLTVLKIWLYHDEGGVWSGLEPCGRSSLWQLFFSQRQHTHVQQQLWYGNTYGTQYHKPRCVTQTHTHPGHPTHCPLQGNTRKWIGNTHCAGTVDPTCELSSGKLGTFDSPAVVDTLRLLPVLP